VSGPSSGAVDSATALLTGVRPQLMPLVYSDLHKAVAAALQEKFDLGHKSAGGAQMDKPPCMGGWLEIALDQAEVDALGFLASCATNPKDSLSENIKTEHRVALTRFLEKISLFRSRR
jgi:hypothetical protein